MEVSMGIDYDSWLSDERAYERYWGITGYDDDEEEDGGDDEDYEDGEIG